MKAETYDNENNRAMWTDERAETAALEEYMATKCFYCGHERALHTNYPHDGHASCYEMVEKRRGTRIFTKCGCMEFREDVKQGHFVGFGVALVGGVLFLASIWWTITTLGGW